MRKSVIGLIALLLVVTLPLTGCLESEKSSTPAQVPVTISQLQVEINTLKAHISTLNGQVANLSSQIAGMGSAPTNTTALEESISALQVQIAELTARIVELEVEQGGGNETETEAVDMTRWSVRFSSEFEFAVGSEVMNDDEIDFRLASIEPRTIKEEDCYTIKFEIENLNATKNAELEDVVIWLRLDPRDDVLVSDDTDIYQVEGPYYLYWELDIRTSKTTGVCRDIYTVTDRFDMNIKAGKTATIKLEFDLVYA